MAENELKVWDLEWINGTNTHCNRIKADKYTINEQGIGAFWGVCGELLHTVPANKVIVEQIINYPDHG